MQLIMYEFKIILVTTPILYYYTKCDFGRLHKYSYAFISNINLYYIDFYETVCPREVNSFTLF